MVNFHFKASAILWYITRSIKVNNQLTDLMVLLWGLTVAPACLLFRKKLWPQSWYFTSREVNIWPKANSTFLAVIGKAGVSQWRDICNVWSIYSSTSPGSMCRSQVSLMILGVLHKAQWRCISSCNILHVETRTRVCQYNSNIILRIAVWNQLLLNLNTHKLSSSTLPRFPGHMLQWTRGGFLLPSTIDPLQISA